MPQQNFMKNKARELRQAQTKEEKLLWNRLRNRQLGLKFIRQFVFDNKFILDFYCAESKLVLEIDGGQHCESNQDKLRDSYLKQRGCRILRFWNNEVRDNLEGCLMKIRENLD